MSQALFMEPIHVLGAGSIGLLFASCIRTAFPSYPIRLLLRPGKRVALQQNRLQVSVYSKQTNQPRVVSIPAEYINNKKKPIHNLLVTTKALHAKQAVESVLSRLDTTSGRIILLCNGALAVREELMDLLLKRQDPNSIKLVLASTTHGAYREQTPQNDEMIHVIHAGVGKTIVQEEAQLSQMWDMAGLHCSSVSRKDIDLVLWKKLAANCVINPITSLLKCPNGHLLRLNNTNELNHKHLMQQALQEVIQVSMATMNHNNLNKRDFETTMQDFVHQVVADTAQNKSSMLQDVLQQQPTEIQYLNGHVVKCGKRHDIPTPANAELCRQIQQLAETFVR